MSELTELFARCRGRGESVALVTVTEGFAQGAQLLVWPGGQALGSLGPPRLNQRVALFAETLFDRERRVESSPVERLSGSDVDPEATGGSPNPGVLERKLFEHGDQRIAVRVEVYSPGDAERVATSL